MATNVNVKLWQPTIDSLNKMIVEYGQPCVLQTRTLTTPTQASTDYREIFTKFADIDLAIDTLKSGVKTFDSLGVETVKTHEGYFEYIDDVTSELWILYKSNRYKIISVEDIGELNGIIKLELNFKGNSSLEGSKA